MRTDRGYVAFILIQLLEVALNDPLRESTIHVVIESAEVSDELYEESS